MTTTIQTAPMANTARLARYRQAEQDLWHAYGLEPIERFVEVSLPRAVVRLRVLEIGAGEPAVFIPGTGGTGPYWAPLIRELPGIRCVMIDRPGWGLSSPLDYRDRDYGETAAAILGGALDAWAWIGSTSSGHRIGDLWGLRLAQREPGRVRRIVALGGGPIADLPAPRFIRLLASPLGALLVGSHRTSGCSAASWGRLATARSLTAGRMDDFFRGALPSTAKRHRCKTNGRWRSILLRDGWRAGFVPTDADLGAVTAPFRMVYRLGRPDGIRRPLASLHQPARARRAEDRRRRRPHAWWDEPTVVGRSVREFLSGPAG